VTVVAGPVCRIQRVTVKGLSGPVRVVLAEDNPFLREGLQRLLSASGRVDVVASCGSLDELLAAVDADQPDVVVTDIRMPPSHTDEGVRAAAELRRTKPGIGVLVLSQYLEPRLALLLLSEGSSRRGYVLKDRTDDVDFLVDAITTIASGGSVIGDEVVETLVQGQLRQPATPLAALSSRELEVLHEVATGKNNAAVASTLIISEHAVQKHINSIFSKLGLVDDGETHRRVRAVLLYLSTANPSTDGV
jgi:DNA-binding NarL/FixJ family response regulator